MKKLLTLALALLLFSTCHTRYAFERDGINVDFPAEYKTDTVDEESPDGTVTRMGVVAETAKCDYALFITTYPAALVQRLGPTELLNNSVTTVVMRMRGTMVKMENGSTEGVPSIKFNYTLAREGKPNGEGLALITHNRVVIIGALYAQRPNNVDDFLQSLRLKKDS